MLRVISAPLNRKRRNSFDSTRGLSARKNAAIAELKSVVSNLESQITEINSVLKSQSVDSLLEVRIFDLQDKITQLDNQSKVQYQALCTRITELESKSENNKLKHVIKNLKSKMKSAEHNLNEKWKKNGNTR